ARKSVNFKGLTKYFIYFMLSLSSIELLIRPLDLRRTNIDSTATSLLHLRHQFRSKFDLL
ncbi:MAG: hypothetical protein QGG39_19105, partial [Candidatus Poribacteria bacterium]|nr:hypothetical protein [Candidatus Poribacteria bacterium]